MLVNDSWRETFPVPLLPVLRHMEPSGQSGLSQLRKWPTLRFAISLIVLASLIVNVAARFIPPERVAFRAWDAASLYATSEGHFAPNFHYANDRTFGDLAKFGNLPSFRGYHREVFTTDEFGFRNSPGNGAGRPPAILVVGDSFAVGCGVSDQDTLSAQLSYLTGKTVYNGGTDLGRWATTKALINRLRMRNGWIVWELSESHAAPLLARQLFTVGLTAPTGTSGVDASENTGRSDLLGKYRRWADDFWAYSPLSIVIDRILLRMQDDVWLPNPSRGAVFVDHLKNGDGMLFMPYQVEAFYHPRYSSSDYFSEVNALVGETGNKLLVVMIPSKYVVYRPLLISAGPSPERQSHWGQFEEELLRLGVPAVNLTSALKLQAAEGLQNKEYDYFIDDTHWNQFGIHIAAAAISQYLKNR